MGGKIIKIDGRVTTKIPNRKKRNKIELNKKVSPFKQLLKDG